MAIRISYRSIFLFLAIIAGPFSLAKGAVFLVTNANDSGPGSLRQAVLDANSAGGPDTIQWSGTGGTIASASALPALTGVVTLDPSAATSTPDILGDLNIGPGLVIAGAMIWDGVLSGAGSLSKTGANTILTLTATNTYTGGTSATGQFYSIILISRDNNLGDPASTLALTTGGNLTLSADMVSDRPMVLGGAGNGDIDTSIHSATFTGTMSGVGQFFKYGSGTLLLSGNISITTGLGAFQGSLILSGANTYGSFTVIGSNATLGVYQDSNLGNSYIINQGGILRTLASTTITKQYAPGSMGLLGSFDTNTSEEYFAQALAQNPGGRNENIYPDDSSLEPWRSKPNAKFGT